MFLMPNICPMCTCELSLCPKWNLSAKGMYETASVYKASDEVEKGKYRTA